MVKLTSGGEFFGIDDFCRELEVRAFLHASTDHGESSSVTKENKVFSFCPLNHLQNYLTSRCNSFNPLHCWIPKVNLQSLVTSMDLLYNVSSQ